MPNPNERQAEATPQSNRLRVDEKNLEFYDHSPGRAGFDTEFAGYTFFGIEYDLHRILIHIERLRGAYGNTCAAMRAAVVVPGDIFTQRLDTDAQLRKIFYAVRVMLLCAGELQNEQPFFLRGDLCL